ncbi:hypothetical protein RND71_032136 [Anisodus tanguticus]|uniref:Uncharacterized protein n=1 Tax=Anisodus tanguticus TaxID=243964 RepID=A0AAE1RCM7_9SOLA|nr:hypothetical protein RND71_032136 [Anisodus tanguticus]
MNKVEEGPKGLVVSSVRGKNMEEQLIALASNNQYSWLLATQVSWTIPSLRPYLLPNLHPTGSRLLAQSYTPQSTCSSILSLIRSILSLISACPQEQPVVQQVPQNRRRGYRRPVQEWKYKGSIPAPQKQQQDQVVNTIAQQAQADVPASSQVVKSPIKSQGPGDRQLPASMPKTQDPTIDVQKNIVVCNTPEFNLVNFSELTLVTVKKMDSIMGLTL